MNNRWAEEYPADYQSLVQRSIGPIPHDLFLKGKAAWLRRFARPRELVRMLDIGCGVGLLHPYLNGFDLTGIDVSPAAVREAEAGNPKARYASYDGVTIPFQSGSFDLAIAVTVMHHVPAESWPSFVAEASRILRPDGVLVIMEHNPINPLTRLSVRKSPLDFDAVLLRAGTTESLLLDAGLVGVGTDYIFFTPFGGLPDRLLRWLPLGAQYVTWGFRA